MQSQDNFIDLKDQNFSLFGKGSKMMGDFYIRGITHILSHVEGTLVVEDNSPLSIDHGATFKGTIKCKDINIYGSFDGDLNSSGKVTIYPSGELSGKLQAKSINIRPGASVNIQGHTDENLQ